MKPQPLVIYGGGPFAAMLAGYLMRDKRYEPVACTVDAGYLSQAREFGLPLISIDDIAVQHPPGEVQMILAVGYANMRARQAMYQKAVSLGYTLANYIHETVLITHDVEYGDNNIVFPGTVIEPRVKISNNNIIWSNVTVCHDTVIGNHNFLAANTTIGGHCVVEDGCFLGFSSTVKDHVRLAPETLLGANSLLLEDSQANGKYLGSPAKLTGRHNDQGIVID